MDGRYMKHKGITLIEMVIGMAILSVILTIVGGVFRQQNVIVGRNQARDETQNKVRMLMQLVGQDLQLSGARTWSDVNGTGNAPNTVSLYEVDAPLGLRSGTSSSGTYARDNLEVQYLTSLRGSSQCRHITYYFSNTTFYRKDLSDLQGTVCGSSGNGGNSSGIALADNILAVDILLRCNDGTFDNSSTPCDATGQYIRSAKVLVTAQSNDPVYGYQGPAYGRTFNTSTGVINTQACPVNRMCFSLEQEVPLPNLRGITIAVDNHDGDEDGGDDD